MRTAKIGREMACFPAGAGYLQSDAVGLRLIRLRAQEHTISETLRKNRLFLERPAPYFGQDGNASPRSLLRSRIMQLHSEMGY